jgi:hypothetical protein
MIPRIEAWTIVIVGAWNVRIFSPEWVSEKLFAKKPIETEINFTSDIRRIRYRSESLVLIPLDDRVIIGARNISDDTLIEAEKVATLVLDLLSHTPILSLGINFSFLENKPSGELVSLFNISDGGQISNSGCKLLKTDIIRNLEVEGGILNLRLSLEETKLEVHFNFTHAIKSTKLAIENLNNRVIAYRDLAYSLLHNVYNLTIEEEEQYEATR